MFCASINEASTASLFIPKACFDIPVKVDEEMEQDAPWAGAPKGFSSSWRLEVLDAAGAALAAVPLDVRPFATHAGAKGKPAVVRGCVVVDSKIGMLVNAPRYAQAARYRFSRTDAAGVVTPLGEVPASEVRELSGDAR